MTPMHTRTPGAPRASHDDHGAVLVWVSLMAIALIGIGALAVDLGYAYAVRRQLSSTADAAALAGAQEAGRRFKDPAVGGCGSTLNGYVTAAVNQTHGVNNPADVATLDNPESVTIACTGPDGLPATGTAASSITVTVTERSSTRTFLGGVLGVSSLSPVASATARVFGGKSQGGLRPFLVCLPDAQQARDEVDAGSDVTHQSYYAKPSTSGSPTGLTLVAADADWAASSDRITAKNHGLSTGDYVWIAVSSGASGATDGFYYVTKVDKDTITLSATRTGSPVNVTTDGEIDIYRPTPIGDGTSSAWAASTDIVTEPNHALASGTRVRVAIRSGAAGATDGYYYVVNPTASTFQLSSTAGGTPVDITSNGVIYVYPTAAGASADCNPTTSPANWGYSAFDYSNSDAPQLSCLIEFGYGAGAACPDSDPPGVNLGTELLAVPAQGDNGNNLQTNDADLIEALVGEAILLPVGSTWNSAGGNNATYQGHGAIAVTLCGFVIPKNNNDPLLAHAKASAFDPGCGSAALYNAAVTAGKVQNTSLVIQWRYLNDWVTSYIGQSSGSSDQCRLDESTCLPTLQLLK